MAGKRRPCKDGKWEMEDMHGLHGSEQGMPKGQLPPAKDRLVGGFHNKAQAPDFYGRILKVQLDKNGEGRSKENYIHHELKALPLQGDALRVEKCRSNLPEISEQNVQQVDHEKYGSIRG